MLILCLGLAVWYVPIESADAAEWLDVPTDLGACLLL